MAKQSSSAFSGGRTPPPPPAAAPSAPAAPSAAPVASKDASAVQLVRMRQTTTQKEADVHPDEVQNMRLHDWVVVDGSE